MWRWLGKTEAVAAAEHMLQLLQAQGRPVTPHLLNKLVVIAQGWMLAMHGRTLYRERIEAWEYGPIVPGVYRRFRRHGNDPMDTGGRRHDGRFDAERLALMEEVVEKYGVLTGLEAASLTSQEGTPWRRAREAGYRYVPTSMMMAHYRDLMASA